MIKQHLSSAEVEPHVFKFAVPVNYLEAPPCRGLLLAVPQAPAASILPLGRHAQQHSCTACPERCAAPAPPCKSLSLGMTMRVSTEPLSASMASAACRAHHECLVVVLALFVLALSPPQRLPSSLPVGVCCLLKHRFLMRPRLPSVMWSRTIELDQWPLAASRSELLSWPKSSRRVHQTHAEWTAGAPLSRNTYAGSASAAQPQGRSTNGPSSQSLLTLA